MDSVLLYKIYFFPNTLLVLIYFFYQQRLRERRVVRATTKKLTRFEKLRNEIFTTITEYLEFVLIFILTFFDTIFELKK